MKYKIITVNRKTLKKENYGTHEFKTKIEAAKAIKSYELLVGLSHLFFIIPIGTIK